MPNCLTERAPWRHRGEAKAAVALCLWLTYTFSFISREWMVSEHDWLTRVGWFLTGNWDLIRDVILAIGAAVTAILLYRRTRATERLAEAANYQAEVAAQQADIASKRHEQQTDADRQRRITESFARAIEQLGSEKREVRIGAIYALERIARESPADHWAIMETLTAYVREKVSLPYPDKEAVKKVKKEVEETGWRVPADVQAALTAIGRRLVEQDASELTLQLDGTNLVRANLQDAHLERANLTDAFLTQALLARTHLEGAHLSSAELDGARLDHTQLLGGLLDHANLRKAFVQSADLRPTSIEQV